MGLVAAIWKEPPEPVDNGVVIDARTGQRIAWPSGPAAACVATVTTIPAGGASVTGTARSSSATGTVATCTGGVTALSTCAPDPVT